MRGCDYDLSLEVRHMQHLQKLQAELQEHQHVLSSHQQDVCSKEEVLEDSICNMIVALVVMITTDVANDMVVMIVMTVMIVSVIGTVTIEGGGLEVRDSLQRDAIHAMVIDINMMMINITRTWMNTSELNQKS